MASTTVLSRAAEQRTGSSRGRWRAGRAVLALLMVWSAVGSSAFGQKLDEFKKSAGFDKGVELIPFPDLRRDATAVADEVQRRKEETDAFKYDVFEKEKNNLLKEIKKREADIKGIQEDIADLKKKYEQIDVSSLENDIKKRQVEIEKIQAAVKQMNTAMEKAVDTFERLHQARAGLREYFDKALKQLSEVRSKPTDYLDSSATKEDEKQLLEYVSKIEDRIKSGESEHRKQEDWARDKAKEYTALIQKT